MQIFLLRWGRWVSNDHKLHIPEEIRPRQILFQAKVVNCITALRESLPLPILQFFNIVQNATPLFWTFRLYIILTDFLKAHKGLLQKKGVDQWKGACFPYALCVCAQKTECNVTSDLDPQLNAKQKEFSIVSKATRHSKHDQYDIFL